jgi:hypothetical protein
MCESSKDFDSLKFFEVVYLWGFDYNGGVEVFILSRPSDTASTAALVTDSEECEPARILLHLEDCKV